MDSQSKTLHIVWVKIHPTVLHVRMCTLHSANLLPWRSLSISLFYFSPLQQHKQKFSHSSETHFFEPNEYVKWLWFLIHGSHSAVPYCIQFSTAINQHFSATEGESHVWWENNSLLSYLSARVLVHRFLSLGRKMFKFDTVVLTGLFLHQENLRKILC